MTDFIIKQMPALKRIYEKLHASQQNTVKAAIRLIAKNPAIGEEKKGDLAGIYVYKFKLNQLEYLLAYEWDALNRILIALGVHENFYRDLKKKNINPVMNK